MIRVVFVQATLEIGGAERLVQELVRGMDRSTIVPYVVNLYGPGPIGTQLAAENFPVVNDLSASRFDVRVAWTLSRVLMEIDADVAYVSDSALPMFWMGVHRRLRPRPRVVLGFHSAGGLGRHLQRFLSRKTAVPVAERLVALTASHRSVLGEELGVPESRFEVVTSGVDLAQFQDSVPQAEARRKSGLPADVPIAGIVAALRPEKNHAFFLRAAARVLGRLSNALFVIVGDGVERASIDRQCEDAGIADRVLRLGTRQDMPTIYRALDVVVLSSVVEALPLVLLEAAACAVPSVTTGVGFVDEIVLDGETGFVVPAGNEIGMACQIERLLRDKGLRNRFGAAALRRARKRFDSRAMIRRYEDLFSTVAGVPR